MSRRMLATVAATALLSMGAAHGQAFLDKPVRLIVASAAGGPSYIVARTLADNLGILLGTPRVVSGALAASLEPAYRVTVDIQRFESVPGEAVTLDALWLVRRAGAAGAASGRSVLREPVQGSGYEALAAAHSRAIAGMSRDIASAIRAAAAP